MRQNEWCEWSDYASRKEPEVSNTQLPEDTLIHKWINWRLSPGSNFARAGPCPSWPFILISCIRNLWTNLNWIRDGEHYVALQLF